MSTEYHQKKKESRKKGLWKVSTSFTKRKKNNKNKKYGCQRNKYLSEGEKAKMANIDESDIEIFQKMRNSGLLSIEKLF